MRIVAVIWVGRTTRRTCSCSHVRAKKNYKIRGDVDSVLGSSGSSFFLFAFSKDFWHSSLLELHVRTVRPINRSIVEPLG